MSEREYEHSMVTAAFRKAARIYGLPGDHEAWAFAMADIEQHMRHEAMHQMARQREMAEERIAELEADKANWRKHANTTALERVVELELQVQGLKNRINDALALCNDAEYYEHPWGTDTWDLDPREVRKALGEGEGGA